jgi:resuscitation-promoting factor RpfB
MTPVLVLVGLALGCLFPPPDGPSQAVSSLVGSPAHVGDSNRSDSLSRASRNRTAARSLAAKYGWASGRQWNCLDRLWHRESRWDDRAKNPSSGAYGIPQKMGVPIRGASAQIRWGLGYIHKRYGTPCEALHHQLKHGWY